VPTPNGIFSDLNKFIYYI
jgi:EF-hand domain-containing protein 1